MRLESEIKQRIRGLLVLELNRRVREASLRCPAKCSYNAAHPLDFRKTVNGESNPLYNHISIGDQTLGLCMYGSEDPKSWSGNICDEPIDAKRCLHFTPRVDKKALLIQFQTDLRNADWVQNNLPGMAELLWVLEMADLPKLPLWKRVWFWLLRVRVEPIGLICSERLGELFEEDSGLHGG